jgi:hypothetical protein
MLTRVTRKGKNSPELLPPNLVCRFLHIPGTADLYKPQLGLPQTAAVASVHRDEPTGRLFKGISGPGTAKIR